MAAPEETEGEERNTAAVAFVLRLARALHSYGYSAQRLEDILSATSDRLGLRGYQFFSTPTSIMASFGSLALQRTHMLRIEPGEVNLSKLAALEQVSYDVARGHVPPDEGSVAIERIVQASSPYGSTVTALAYGAVSGAACQFLGGGMNEIAVATTLGLGLGILALFARDHPRLGGVFEPTSAFLVSIGAVGLARIAGPVSVLIATLSGLIVLIPGLTLTTAMTELATRHLASGTARLSSAFITFLGIAFGVALGNRLGGVAFGVPAPAEPIPLPPWATLAALIVAPLCFTVILRAAPRDTLWIIAAGAIGVVGGRIGAALLGVELGTFTGALAVALASGGFERWRHRPAAVVLVPGLLLLVPGSVGFRSLSSLLERKALAGIETGFSMLITAVALVAGLLIAGVILPEPRLHGDERRPGAV